jgi:hypothetical protein
LIYHEFLHLLFSLNVSGAAPISLPQLTMTPRATLQRSLRRAVFVAQSARQTRGASHPVTSSMSGRPDAHPDSCGSDHSATRPEAFDGMFPQQQSAAMPCASRV